jgi:hypothetical protein
VTAAPDAGEPQPIVYLDRSDVHEGPLDDLKAGIARLVEFIEAREPRLLAYGFHLDEQARTMTVLAVHPDSASLELHLEVGREEFRKLGELITLQSIEVYGPVSARARGLLNQKLEMLGEGGVVVSERYAGFSRLAPVDARRPG